MDVLHELLLDFQKADSSSHSGRYESVLLWFGLATSSRYVITALDLAPHVVAILAGVGPLWQMVTIISHNSVNTETRGELWSDGLLALKANRTWSNVWLLPKCEGFFSSLDGVLQPILSTKTNISGCYFFLKCSNPFPSWLAVGLKQACNHLGFNAPLCCCNRGSETNVLNTHCKFRIY